MIDLSYMEGKSPKFSFLIRMNAEAAYRLPKQLLDDPSMNNAWQMTRSIKFEAKQMK